MKKLFTNDNILNIISIILVLIIISTILLGSIYYNKYEKFTNIIEQFDNQECNILNKCPRGCGHHSSVPSCENCSSDKPDYDTATLEERKWIDEFHIKGDQSEALVLGIIENWKKINPNARFRFTLYHVNDLGEGELKAVNIHPNYQIELYEKYNPDSVSTIDKVSKWMKQFNLNINNYPHISNIIETVNNWKYIDIKPPDWVTKSIDNYLDSKSENNKKKLYIELFNLFDINKNGELTENTIKHFLIFFWSWAKNNDKFVNRDDWNIQYVTDLEVNNNKNQLGIKTNFINKDIYTYSELNNLLSFAHDYIDKYNIKIEPVHQSIIDATPRTILNISSDIFNIFDGNNDDILIYQDIKKFLIYSWFWNYNYYDENNINPFQKYMIEMLDNSQIIIENEISNNFVSTVIQKFITICNNCNQKEVFKNKIPQIINNNININNIYDSNITKKLQNFLEYIKSDDTIPEKMEENWKNELIKGTIFRKFNNELSKLDNNKILHLLLCIRIWKFNKVNNIVYHEDIYNFNYSFITFKSYKLNEYKYFITDFLNKPFINFNDLILLLDIIKNYKNIKDINTDLNSNNILEDIENISNQIFNIFDINNDDILNDNDIEHYYLCLENTQSTNLNNFIVRFKNSKWNYKNYFISDFSILWYYIHHDDTELEELENLKNTIITYGIENNLINDNYNDISIEPFSGTTWRTLSEETSEETSGETSGETSPGSSEELYNIYNLSDDTITTDEDRIISRKEYLKNIAGPLLNSHKYAKKRWIYLENLDIQAYSNYILSNIKKGNGLHIDDIIWLAQFSKEKGQLYINKLLEDLKSEENNRKEMYDNFLINNKGHFQYNIDLSCKKNNENLFTKVILPKSKLNDTSNEIDKLKIFWPIFSREDHIYTDINKYILTNNENKEKNCEENLCTDNIDNGVECLFISNLAKI